MKIYLNNLRHKLSETPNFIKWYSLTNVDNNKLAIAKERELASRFESWLQNCCEVDSGRFHLESLTNFFFNQKLREFKKYFSCNASKRPITWRRTWKTRCFLKGDDGSVHKVKARCMNMKIKSNFSRIYCLISRWRSILKISARFADVAVEWKSCWVADDWS